MEKGQIFLYLAVILFSTKFLGIICKKIGLPQVVGALIAGILIGPLCIGVVKANDPILKAMGSIGVVLLMFSAGLDTNMKEIKRNGVPSIVITILGVVVPLAGGFIVAWAFQGFNKLDTTQSLLHCLFFGIMLTATSVGITVEVLRELGKLKGKVGASILSAAILDDIIGIVILSVAIGVNNGNVNVGAIFLKILGFFAVCGVLGVIFHYAFKWLSKKFPVTRRLPIFGLVVCFLFAYLAELPIFGIADITGAFIAGMVMSNMQQTEYVEKKININSYMIFSPIFFANIGINMSFEGFTWSIAGFSFALVAVGLLSKIIGCGAGAKLCGYSWSESAKVGFGMMARGEVVLIIAQKGIDNGIIDAMYMPAVILLIIISSLMTPICLKLLYRKNNTTPLELEGDEPPEFGEEIVSDNYVSVADKSYESPLDMSDSVINNMIDKNKHD